MRISVEEAKSRYGIEHVWTRLTNLDSVDLCSGTENDPIMQAKIDSPDLAIDRDGKELPYDINISFFGIHLEEGESIYEMNRSELYKRQLIQTQMLVFKNFTGYQKYKDDNAIIVFQPNEE